MTADGATALARLALVLAYPLLAHLAGARHDGALAALALADLALVVLLMPLLHGRAWAWALAAVIGAGLWRLAGSGHALLPLLLVPAAVIAFVGYGFGRTLRAGRVPLITRIVAAMDGIAPAQLAPDLQAYTRALTRAWATLLGTLAAANLVLALLVVPQGVLAGLGLAPPVAVDERTWSLVANGLNYGIVGAFFLVEFALRKRRFPGRYRHFLHFLQRMAGLGPAFWRDVFR